MKANTETKEEKRTMPVNAALSLAGHLGDAYIDWKKNQPDEASWSTGEILLGFSMAMHEIVNDENRQNSLGKLIGMLSQQAEEKE